MKVIKHGHIELINGHKIYFNGPVASSVVYFICKLQTSEIELNCAHETGARLATKKNPHNWCPSINDNFIYFSLKKFFFSFFILRFTIFVYWYTQWSFEVNQQSTWVAFYGGDKVVLVLYLR